MAKKSAIISTPLLDATPVSETVEQHFDRILSHNQFKILKAVLDQLQMDATAMRGAIVTTNSYRNFLSKLGYRIILVPQIHEQDWRRIAPGWSGRCAR